MARVFSALIVVFWLVMMALLIKLEWKPDESNLLVVPPEHVLKLMFLHDQVSELSILDNGKPIGNVMLHPQTDPATGNRTLILTGGFSYLPQGAKRKQRLSWESNIVMDHTYGAKTFEFTATIPSPATRVHVVLDPINKRGDYDIQQGKAAPLKSSVPLTEEGVMSLLRDELGYDPSAMLQGTPFGGLGSPGSMAGMHAPVLTAKQTQLSIRKEKVAAYLLTFKQGETTLAEIYVSQLGQVLLAKSIFGYSLATEDTLP